MFLLGMVHLNYCSQEQGISSEISTFFQCFSAGNSQLDSLGIAMDYAYSSYDDDYPQEVMLYLYAKKQNTSNSGADYTDKLPDWEDILKKGSSLKFKSQESPSEDQCSFCISDDKSNYNIGTFPKELFSWRCRDITLYYYMPCGSDNYNTFFNASLAQVDARLYQESKDKNDSLCIMLAKMERNNISNLRRSNKWMRDSDGTLKEIEWLVTSVMTRKNKPNLEMPFPPIRKYFSGIEKVVLNLQRKQEQLQKKYQQDIENLKRKIQENEDSFQKKQTQLHGLLSNKTTQESNVQRYTTMIQEEPNESSWMILKQAAESKLKETQQKIDNLNKKNSIIRKNLEDYKKKQQELNEVFKEESAALQDAINNPKLEEQKKAQETNKRKITKKVPDIYNKPTIWRLYIIPTAVVTSIVLLLMFLAKQYQSHSFFGIQ